MLPCICLSMFMYFFFYCVLASLSLFITHNFHTFKLQLNKNNRKNSNVFRMHKLYYFLDSLYQEFYIVIFFVCSILFEFFSVFFFSKQGKKQQQTVDMLEIQSTNKVFTQNTLWKCISERKSTKKCIRTMKYTTNGKRRQSSTTHVKNELFFVASYCCKPVMFDNYLNFSHIIRIVPLVWLKCSLCFVSITHTHLKYACVSVCFKNHSKWMNIYKNK